MDYWQTGTGIERIAAELVAAQYRYGDERGMPRTAPRRPGHARRVVVGFLLVLAARLDPAPTPTRREVSSTGAANPAI